MPALQLYLDEDVPPLLAVALRDRGIDAVSTQEASRLGATDIDQWKRAVSENRALLRFNIKDFVPLATREIAVGHAFPGLIVSAQLSMSELLRRVLRLRRSGHDVANQIIWLSDHR